MRDISCIRLYSFLVYLSQNFRQTAVIFQSPAQYMFVQENQELRVISSWENQKRNILSLFMSQNKALRFSSTPKKVLAKILSAKKVHRKISNPKKVPSREFQTQKRSSHVPVTNIPEYPPWGFLWQNFIPNFVTRENQCL